MSNVQSRIMRKSGTGKSMVVVAQLFISLLLSQMAWGQEPFTAVVSKVIDGDSLQVTLDRRKIEIRLYGIDCPEYDQRSSKNAKMFAKSNVYGEKVTVYPEYNDSYGRLVAIVNYNEQTLNHELVASGHAWVYPRYCKKEICKLWKKSEKKASKNKIGLWSEQNPVPPWKWKRKKKQ